MVYLRLGEASGTTASDASGNGLDGTYNGSPTLGVTGALAGDSNTSVTLNGTSQSVTVPYNAAMTTSTALSIEAWIKTTASGYTNVLDRDVLGDRVWQFRLNSGKLEFVKVGGTGGIVTASATTPLVNDGSWHHVAATYDGSNIRLYVDGALVKTQAASGNLGTATPRFAVGVNNSGSGGSAAGWFPGSVDEAAYYTTVLSDARISAHYTAATTAGPTAASGTASLSLTASGGAGATSGGSASLSLSASGGTSAPAGGSASLSLSASGAFTPPSPAAGAAALALTASGGASGSPGGSASLNLIATGTALAVLAASGSATLTLTASGSAVMSAGGTAVLTLTAGGVAVALYETDTSNALDGLDLLLTAQVIFAAPVATPPTPLAERYDVAIPYPVPVMVDGRPT
jgi:hypothetical protein